MKGCYSDSCILNFLSNQYDPHIHHIGLSGSGDEQVVNLFEIMKRIIVGEVNGGIHSLLLSLT